MDWCMVAQRRRIVYERELMMIVVCLHPQEPGTETVLFEQGQRGLERG